MSRKIIWQKWMEPEVKAEPENDENMNLPVLFSPIGFISHKMYAGLKNDIKFWVGNANFDITENEAKIIDAIPGVEIFNVMTRYKFRVSPGKAFKASHMREAIEMALGCTNRFNLDEATIYSIRSDIIRLNQRKDPWLIFILPNGKYEYYQDKMENFKPILEKYREIEGKICGNIITSSGV